MTLSVRVRHAQGSFGLDAAFDAPKGLTVLFGRSGAGKTTIINAVAGLLRPDAGLVSIDGTVLLDTARGINCPVHRRRIGYIFQDNRLFPHLSAKQNLLYGRRFALRDTSPPDFASITDLLGINHLLDQRPGTLSGGERQRVAIGRALMAAPRLILADEPLAALDEPRRAEIMPYFERLRDEIAVPILYVSHAAAEVARLASSVVAIEAGRVVAQGPALEILGDARVTPLGAREAGAVLETVVAAHHSDGLSELAAGDARLLLPQLVHTVGTRLRVRIAAQDVILAKAAPQGLSALNVLAGRVVSIRRGTGPGAMVSLDTPAGRIIARITQRSAEALGLAEGMPCHAIIKSLAIAPDNIAEISQGQA